MKSPKENEWTGPTTTSTWPFLSCSSFSTSTTPSIHLENQSIQYTDIHLHFITGGNCNVQLTIHVM